MNERSIKLSTWLPDEALVLEHAHLREDLGRPFEFQLDLLSKTFDVDLGGVLAKPMVISVDLPAGGTRYFNGLVSQFTLAEQHGEYRRYHATLRPWLWLLSRTANSKIFQNLTVPDVVKAVFRARGFSDFEDRLSESYRTWDYLVQYRESDLNFVNRLMEQEGIYYFFEHEAEKHTLVLADSYGAHKPTTGYEILPFLPPETAAAIGGKLEHVGSWKVSRQIQAGAYAVTDFNFETPRADLLSTLQGQPDDGDPSLEIFDYPGEFKNQDEGQAVAKVDLQERQADIERAEGLANARGLTTGSLFTLADYPREDQNKEYLLVSTSISLAVSSFISGAGGGQSEEFHCSFTALDSQRQFRSPRRTPKPMVQGPQTAIVVGQAGEEIWTDQYGRVKVQFHWDREGKNDEKSSCWVRVAQVWAGAKWGAMHIPRIGQEVIVDFLEGDPDRPIITGRVYNADNMPPYDLPDNQTQSGIKSRSTKGGAPSNFNEIRFEDKKGSEEMFIQAEKNQTIKVKHDRGATIGGSDSISVGGDRSVSVSGNLSVTVQGGGKGAVHSMQSVTGKHGLHASDTIEIDAPTHIKLTCGGSSLLIEPGKITLTSGGNAFVVLDANVLAQSSAGSKVVLDANALAKSSGGSEVLLDANVLAKSSGGASVTLDSNAAVDGAKATVTGKSEVVVSAGAGTAKFDGGGVAISGPVVKVNG